MVYISTRGGGQGVTSAAAIKTGIAPDGGLYVPAEQVTFAEEKIFSLAGLTYQERAVTILRPFLPEFTDEEVAGCVHNAYNESSFHHPSVTPLVHLDEKLSVLELWHGPTCAFKDIALQMLPHLLVKSMEKTGESARILILVATSGDTGKAALEGFRDVDRTAIMVFYPDEGVSQVQKLQMVTQEGNNVGVAAVKGNFDDTQSGIKKIFSNNAVSDEIAQYGYKFSSANSINWGRLVPQIVYYFSAYADLLRDGVIKAGDMVNFVVPTGNFGNILAGYYAKMMGLPVNKLICAANANNVLSDFIRTGIYDRNRRFVRTISPSMDILISSNLERLLFALTEHNHARVRAWMNQLQDKGRYTVDEQITARIQKHFWSDYASDRETIDTIKNTYRRYRYVVDTHTAVGLRVYEKFRLSGGDSCHTVVLSTASPFKFNASVAAALLGEEQTSSRSEFDLLHMLADISGLPIPHGLRDLAKRKVIHKSVIERDKMRQAVISFVSGLK